MMAGRATVIPGARNKVMAQATRLVPRTFAARLARQAQQKAH
jgi:short-subunit dehydrogenase